MGPAANHPVGVETSRSNLELELAFEDIELFILVVMQLTFRATLRQEGVLKDEEITWVLQCQADLFTATHSDIGAAMRLRGITKWFLFTFLDRL